VSLNRIFNLVKVYTLSEIIAKGLNWLLMIILPFILETKDYGMIGLIVAYELMLAPLFQGGQPLTLLRLYNRFKNHENRFLHTIFNSWIKWILLLLPIILALTFFFQNELVYYLVVFALPLQAINEITINLLRAKQDTKNYLRIRIGYQALKFLFVIILCLLGLKGYSYPIGIFIAVSLNIINIIIYFRKNRINIIGLNTNSKLEKIFFNFSIPIMFQNISSGVLLYLNRFMIKDVFDDSTVGIFTFLYSLSFSLFVILMIGGIIFQPFLYKFKNNNETSENYLMVYTNLIFLIVFAFGTLLFFSFDFLSILYSTTYLNNKSTFILLLMSMLFWPFYNQGNFRIMLINKPFLLPISTAISAFVNFILNIFLLKKYNIEGAALSYFIATAILVFLVNCLSVSNINNIKNLISLIIVIIITIISTFIVLNHKIFLLPFVLIPLVISTITELYKSKTFIKINLLGKNIKR
jgi:O-antigen/teichoic acid export membrane protein